jgi:hypothetical protein
MTCPKGPKNQDGVGWLVIEADVDDRRRWWNKSGGSRSTYIRWAKRPSLADGQVHHVAHSGIGTLIFIAAVVVMVALLLLA